MNLDLGIYVLHAAFWTTFAITRMILRRLDRGGGEVDAEDKAPTARKEATARFSRLLLAFHMVAFGAMYFGLGQAVIPRLVPEWFVGQRIAGTVVIASGAALMAWALAYFRSWRFRAKLDEGHQLATGGPFGLMRHPLYMGLNLLALGTAVRVPTQIVWVGFALMVVGSDLRGRAEEKLLEASFGETYRAYCTGTRRFVPGIY